METNLKYLMMDLIMMRSIQITKRSKDQHKMAIISKIQQKSYRCVKRSVRYMEKGKLLNVQLRNSRIDLIVEAFNQIIFLTDVKIGFQPANNRMFRRQMIMMRTIIAKIITAVMSKKKTIIQVRKVLRNKTSKSMATQYMMRLLFKVINRAKFHL